MIHHEDCSTAAFLCAINYEQTVLAALFFQVQIFTFVYRVILTTSRCARLFLLLSVRTHTFLIKQTPFSSHFYPPIYYLFSDGCHHCMLLRYPSFYQPEMGRKHNLSFCRKRQREKNYIYMSSCCIESSSICVSSGFWEKFPPRSLFD